MQGQQLSVGGLGRATLTIVLVEAVGSSVASARRTIDASTLSPDTDGRGRSSKKHCGSEDLLHDFEYMGWAES